MISDRRPNAPKRKLRSEFVVAALLMTAAAVGLVFWKLSSVPRPPPDEPMASKISGAPEAPDPPERPRRPPPPPPPAIVEATGEIGGEPAVPPVHATQASEASSRQPSARQGDPCASPCNGVVDPALEAALRARGAQARSCYNLALEQNPELSGRLVLSVRVGENGQTCGAAIALNELKSPEVEGCVLSRFRGGQFPTPSGGCVDTRVPLNFKQRNNPAP